MSETCDPLCIYYSFKTHRALGSGERVAVLVGQNGSPSTANSCKYNMQRELEVLELSKKKQYCSFSMDAGVRSLAYREAQGFHALDLC